MKPLSKKEYEEASVEALELLKKIHFILKKQRVEPVGLEIFRDTKESSGETKTIKKVEFPKEGGILTFFAGSDIPKKGFPSSDTVENIDEVKKQAMALAKRLKNLLAGNKMKLGLLYLFFRKELYELAKGFIESLWALIRRYRSKPEYYCQCVREIYRVFNIFVSEEKDNEKKELLEKIRDLVCMVLEFDDAYRYRFQDIFVEVNKQAFIENPEKELNRLFDILIERDPDLKEKWRMLNKFVPLLRINKKLRDFTIRFVYETNINEIRMDESDLFYCQNKEGYLWQQKREKENNTKTE